MPLGDSSLKILVTKDTAKMSTDIPSKFKFNSKGEFGDSSFVLALTLFFLEAWAFCLASFLDGVPGVFVGVVEDSVDVVKTSGDVSGGGVSGADSPSPYKIKKGQN